MTKANLYSAKGRKLSSITLPKNFNEKANGALLAQAIRVYSARQHPGLSKVKSRGEVGLTTRKWYRQKGTGRARHGAQSAPIFVGGGIAHGPKGKKRELFLSKKMRRKALNLALSQKAKNGKVVAVDGLANLEKTKQAQELINKIFVSVLENKKAPRITFVLAKESKSALCALRNIKNVAVVSFKDLNAYSAFMAGTLVIDKAVFEKSKAGSKGKESQVPKKEAKRVKNNK